MAEEQSNEQQGGSESAPQTSGKANKPTAKTSAPTDVPLEIAKPDSGLRFKRTIDDGGRETKEEITDLVAIEELRPWFVSAEAVLEDLVKNPDKSVETKPGFKYQFARKLKK